MKLVFFEKIKSILNTFAYVTTGVLVGTAIYIKIFWGNPQLSVETLWQILAVSFLCSLGNIIYINKQIELDDNSLKKQLLIRIVAHYLYINSIVIGFGFVFDWFHWYRVDMMISISLMIFVIYVIIWFINFMRDKELANQLNEKLREYYKKE